jgi:hypothetical protein
MGTKRRVSPTADDRVTAVTRDEFDDALDAVTAAAIAYRGGLTNDDAATATRTLGTNPWTPIYRQLMADLQATLRAAGHRYDELADARRIDQADRFDWRSYLTPAATSDPTQVAAVWATEAPNIHLRSHLDTTRQSTSG